MICCTSCRLIWYLPTEIAGVRHLGIEVAPGRLALGLPPHELDGDRGPHRLHQMRIFLGLGEDLLLHARAHGRKHQAHNDEVQDDGANHDEGERRRIEEQDRGGDDRHQAVDDRGDDAARDGVLDRLHGAEARDYVADVALLEVVGGQPQEMAHEIADHLERQEMAEHAQRPVAQRLDHGLEHDQSAEAEREHEQAAARRNGRSPRRPRAAAGRGRRTPRSAARARARAPGRRHSRRPTYATTGL